jgi:drug/metabolite transporter (DMT)-like permease
MTPTDWILSIEGTAAGAHAAMALALFSAFAHATLGALQKGRHDPWTSRGAIDLWAAVIALPVALFLVPAPDAFLWLVLAGAWVIQTAYKVLMAMAYTRGHYTLVYPIVRGTGPLATIVFAGIVFGETFNGGQWFGVGLLSGGIFGLAVINIRSVLIGRARLQAAVFFAVLTGVSVAIYTTYDAYGIRLSPDPFTFLAWFFVGDGVVMPLIAVLRHRRLAAAGPVRRAGRAWQFWRRHAGDPAGQGRRGGRAARNIGGLRRPDRLVLPRRAGRARTGSTHDCDSAGRYSHRVRVTKCMRVTR